MWEHVNLLADGGLVFSRTQDSLSRLSIGSTALKHSEKKKKKKKKNRQSLPPRSPRPPLSRTNLFISATRTWTTNCRWSWLLENNLFIQGPPDPSEELLDDTDEEGKCKRWADFVCGIPEKSEELHDADTEIAMKERFLSENPFWRKVLNANAAFALIVLAFITGFFRWCMVEPTLRGIVHYIWFWMRSKLVHSWH